MALPGQRLSGNRESVGRCALLATGLLIREQPIAPGLRTLHGKALTEILGSTRMNLGRCALTERVVWHDVIVLLDEERNEPAHLSLGGEVVQVQPLMLEREPPSLDHRVGESDLDLGEDALQGARIHQAIDEAVHVLDTAVHEHLHGQVGTGLDEHVVRAAGFQPVVQAPREDLARVVVDHGVQVEPGAVEQTDDRAVDVPVLVRTFGADVDLRLRRIAPLPRPAPGS